MVEAELGPVGVEPHDFKAIKAYQNAKNADLIVYNGWPGVFFEDNDVG